MIISNKLKFLIKLLTNIVQIYFLNAINANRN